MPFLYAVIGVIVIFLHFLNEISMFLYRTVKDYIKLICHFNFTGALAYKLSCSERAYLTRIKCASAWSCDAMSTLLIRWLKPTLT